MFRRAKEERPLQPLSCCVLGNAKTGCTAGAQTMLVCEGRVGEAAAGQVVSEASETLVNFAAS